LLGMRSSALANVHCLQCRGDTSCGVRTLGMHACLYFVAVVLGLGGGSDASLGARLLGMRSTGSVLANAHYMQCRGGTSCSARMLGMQA